MEMSKTFEDYRKQFDEEMRDRAENPLKYMRTAADLVDDLERRYVPVGEYVPMRGEDFKALIAHVRQLEARAAQQVQAAAWAKPFAWFRRRSDGYLEGPIFDGDERICDTRRAFWTPLYTQPSSARESDKTRLLDVLKATRRELQACQSVIHLAGGFDPAYVKGAQAAIKDADDVIHTMSREQSPEGAVDANR